MSTVLVVRRAWRLHRSRPRSMSAQLPRPHPRSQRDSQTAFVISARHSSLPPPYPSRARHPPPANRLWRCRTVELALAVGTRRGTAQTGTRRFDMDFPTLTSAGDSATTRTAMVLTSSAVVVGRSCCASSSWKDLRPVTTATVTVPGSGRHLYISQAAARRHASSLTRRLGG